jgi:hypothetical protein
MAAFEMKWIVLRKEAKGAEMAGACSETFWASFEISGE